MQKNSHAPRPQASSPPAESPPTSALPLPLSPTPAVPQREIGGPPGPEPTRYGDWEKNGRCIDF
jgi:hypothetical protein